MNSPPWYRHSSLGFGSSFGVRHSSFVPGDCLMSVSDPSRSLTAYTALSPSLFSTRTAAADALATRLAEEMAERWRRGGRPLPEEFLDRHKELWDRPEAAVQL